MFTGILITDGGPHPADKWAVFVAEKIVPTADVKIGSRPALALKLQLAVAEAIENDFDQAQKDEQAKLTADPAHFLTEHDVDGYVDNMMTDIASCTNSSPWDEHYQRDEVRREIRALLVQHVRDALHIERLWHADRNPDLEHGQAYKKSFGLA